MTGTDTGPGHRSILVSVLRTPRGVIATGFLLVTTVACVLAPLLAPHDPLFQDLRMFQQGPSAAHWLGTDTLGRDVLSRVLHGGTTSLVAVLQAVVVRLIVAVPLGLAAGYLGGTTDRVITRVADVLMSVPVIIILLAVLTIFNRNLTAAMVTFGFLGAFGLMRVIRGVALATREELYIAAAHVIGLSRWQVMVRHVLPRCRGVIIVQTALFAAVALGVQTGLTYLGLGPPPPLPTWGGMVDEASTVVAEFPWLLVPSGAIIALTVIAFGILGDVVRDITAERHSASGGMRAVPHRPERTKAAAPPAPSPSAALLSIEDLTVHFQTRFGAVRVVNGVSFDVAPGETVGLVGESGSGKTVTAKAVIGLLARNGQITDGRVLFDGTDISRLGPRELRAIRGRRIALVTQEPMLALDPSFRVGAQLADVIRAHEKLDRRAVRARVVELLRMTQVPEPEEVARRYPHQISGGMAQRVGIAAALAGRPDLLIADEPTTALDVTVQAEILDLLRSLQASTGMAILLVTHDWGVVADLCGRVVVMYAGQVVETAPIDDLFQRPGHPYTRALLDSSPERSHAGAPINAIPGSVPPPHEWPVGCHFLSRCQQAQPDCGDGPIETVELGARRSARCRYPSQPSEKNGHDHSTRHDEPARN